MSEVVVWVLVDSLSGEPEVFADVDEAVELGKDILREHAKIWGYDDDDLGVAYSELEIDGNAYLGDLEVSIFKKSISLKGGVA